MNEKWAFSSLPTKFCATAPAPRTRTAIPTALYRRMQIGTAQREIFRSDGERFLAPGYGCVSHADGLADTATSCFPTGPTSGTRATTVCGVSGKSARLRPRMEYIWFDFWTTREPSSFLFLRRATRLRRKLYEVLGVCKITWLARLHGGSSVT